MPTKVSLTLPGKEGDVSYKFYEDMCEFNVLDVVDKIKADILLLVGQLDDGTTPQSQQELYNLLTGPKVFYEIEGMEHTPISEKHIKQMQKILNDWLST